MVHVAQANLIVQGGPNSGREITLSARPLTMGRRADNDIVIDHTTVSRRHSLVMETPTGFVLRDLNSTNGTFVNGGKLDAGEHGLKHGDRIRLAGSDETFIFRQEGQETQQMRMDGPMTGEVALPEQPAQGPVPVEQPADPPGKDAQLLRFLESRKGAAVSREDIARAVWPELPQGAETDREIDQAVERLREELEDDPSRPAHLIPVGEYGFLLL